MSFTTIAFGAGVGEPVGCGVGVGEAVGCGVGVGEGEGAGVGLGAEIFRTVRVIDCFIETPLELQA